MQINFTYDTETKNASCTIDGVEVPDFYLLMFEKYEYSKPHCCVRSRSEKDEVYTETTVHASVEDTLRKFYANTR